VDGVIYDVTNVPQWRNGEHNGFSAGQDLTDEIKSISPHGVSKLKTVPVVGRLAD
jgi:predicted heme/steroid binding protein